MDRPLIRFHGYETYYFAFAVRNILHDPISYLRNLDEIYGDEKYLQFTFPFPRYSAFHEFLEVIIGSLIFDVTEKVDLEERRETIRRFHGMPKAIEETGARALPIELALDFHKVKYQPFVEWLAENESSFDDASADDVYEYIGHLQESGAYGQLLLQSVREVFYVLFSNRQVLALFNKFVAGYITEFDVDEPIAEEAVSLFQKSGVLKRCHVPTWVQRAVYFRDRGVCVSCHRDLSGILNIWSQKHFDHIIPLRAGGMNDVTNIQLMCEDCNLKKSGKAIDSPNLYQDWYLLPGDDLDSL